jgi:uncharacterized membrane protein YphA (DoxX/SURF4 family)
MNRYTQVLLVLLRLAIGWHFLFEGLSKLDTYTPVAPPKYPRQEVKNTTYGFPPDHPVRSLPPSPARKARKPWTSEPYLRGATGPLAGVFQWMAGDPLLDHLEVLPAEEGEPQGKLYARLPEGLAKDWRAYFDALAAHYDIQGRQLDRLETILRQRQDVAVRWLISGTHRETKNPVAGSAPIDKDVTVPQLVQRYKDAMARIEQLEAVDRYTTLRPNLDSELAEARADLTRQRADLQTIVENLTEEMKVALQAAVTPKQKKNHGPVPVPVSRHWTDWDRLDWIDFTTRWGLTVVGVLLLAGLCTRTACVGGAVFLLMFYLAMPPFPGLPENPKAEGHYLFINKNIIEMLALLALAGTRSGRWMGLDGLVQFLNPRRWNRNSWVPPEQVDPKANGETQGAEP